MGATFWVAFPNTGSVGGSGYCAVAIATLTEIVWLQTSGFGGPGVATGCFVSVIYAFTPLKVEEVCSCTGCFAFGGI